MLTKWRKLQYSACFQNQYRTMPPSTHNLRRFPIEPRWYFLLPTEKFNLQYAKIEEEKNVNLISLELICNNHIVTRRFQS